MATIAEQVREALRQDFGISVAALDLRLPDAVVEEIKKDPYRQDGPDDADFATYAAAFGVAWATAVQEDPYADPASIRSLALEAASEATVGYYHHGVERDLDDDLS